MKTKIIWGVIIVVVIGLFLWGRSMSLATTQTFAGTDVPCLVSGHQSLAEHVHPRLSISVDGVEEEIPANVGVTQSCMAEVHTHDTSGELHVESSRRGNIDKLRLSDFFAVWGEDIEREGFDVEIRVGGDVVERAEEVRFRDLERIEVIYTSQEESTDIATTTEEV